MTRVRWALASLGAICLACGGTPQGLTGPTTLPPSNRAEIPSAPEAAVRVLPTEIFVGAGDIGQCTNGGVPDATARLLDSISGTVFALGDNAYPSGTAQDYQNCYDASWGRHKGRTRPVAGNHEYDTAVARPYYDYFGTNAGPSGVGFYSYDLGNWHVVALNSNIAVGAGSKHGNIEQMREFWRILYDAGADVVLSAHDHVYERFAPQDPDGSADPQRGIREFIAGTGGAPPYPFVDVKPNSEARLSTVGVLKLALKAGGYDWNFIPVSGAGDSGSGTCH